MFEFLLSEEKKMRRHAANWLEVADRVHKFRRDQLTPVQGQQLLGAAGELKARLGEKADASRLKMAIEKLEGVLRETGGRLYPASSLVENVEFFVVAAIVILGLRAYFVQPFKIPTNSMWPSYHGMTHELFADGREPGVLERAGRLVAFGATHFSATAEADGEILIPVNRDLRVPYSEKPGRTFGLIPTMRREYQFMVGGAISRFEVPLEFDFDRVIEEAFGGEKQDFVAAVQARIASSGRQPESSTIVTTLSGRNYDQRVFWVPTGKKVRRGEKVVSFDIHTGDLLFVDRFTYNFFPPKVGQGFVFKTENIVSPAMQTRNGDQVKQYYIKRLVGGPGDSLEIKTSKTAEDSGSAGVPMLLRNGSAITGAPAFAANAERRGNYPGYVAGGLLAPGNVAQVPPHMFMALGDNSPRSQDSRFWGYIPEKDVVGKPLFIYYPFSRRWGVAN